MRQICMSFCALFFTCVLLAPPAQADSAFVRGDVDPNGELEITDAVRALRYLFLGSEAPECLDAIDANDDGESDLSDAVYILSYLFLGGSVLPEPFPVCGTDPTSDALDCVRYDGANCPRIDSISPDRGSVAGGLRVTVRGDHLPADTIVYFGDNPGRDVVVLNPQVIEATAPPARAAGPVDVILLYGTSEIVLRGAFTYTGSTAGGGTDTDGDGLSDAAEAAGWEVWVDAFGFGFGVDTFGNVTRYMVTSDPLTVDGDGDGLTDLEEFANRSDPGKADTDGDGLYDGEEIYRWYTSPTSVDSDGDSRGSEGRLAPTPALFDGQEIFDISVLYVSIDDPRRVVKVTGTSPSLADTDGDNVTDYDELDTPVRTPILADLPRLEVIPVGEVDVRLNIEYAEAEGTTTETSVTLASEVSQTRSVETSTTNSVSAEVAVTLGTEGGGITLFGVESEIAVTVGYSFEHTRTVGRESTRTASREVSDTKSRSFEQTETFATGSMRAAVVLRNTGNTSFTLRGFSMLAKRLDRAPALDPRRPHQEVFQPIGTLLPAVDEITLAPGEESPPIELAATELNGAVVKEYLEQANVLALETASFDLATADGLSFDFISEVTLAQTALVIIDYGDGTQEAYNIATNVQREPDASFAGISMGQFLEGVLELPLGDAASGFTVAQIDPLLSTLQLESLRGRGTARSNGQLVAKWIVAGTTVDQLLTGGFLDMRLHAGDQVLLKYSRDTDGDSVPDAVETAFGTDIDPQSSDDADGDQLTDFEEIVRGWIVFEDPANPFPAGAPPAEGTLNLQGFPYVRVTSNPVLADSDGDGLDDHQEFLLRSNPTEPDTDQDGLNDADDPHPTIQGRLICVHPTQGSGNPDACLAPRADGTVRPYDPACAWRNAVRTLQQALEIQRNGAATADPYDDVVEVWVARGVYRPDQSAANPAGNGDRFATFDLPNALGVYGGFNGPVGPQGAAGSFAGESKRGQRDPNPVTNGTVLSGDLLEDDLGIVQGTTSDPIDLATAATDARRTDNSQRVVFARSGVGRSAVLDGFQIYGAFSAAGTTVDGNNLTLGGGIAASGGGDPNTTGFDCPGQPISGTGEFGFELDDGSSISMPGGTCDRPGKDKFFLWTAERTDGVILETCNRVGVLDTILVAYDVTGLSGFCNAGDLNAPGVYLGCNDDDACGSAARLTFNAVAGRTYLLRIGVAPNTANSGDRGLFALSYATQPPPVCPTSGNPASRGSDCPGEAVSGTGIFGFDLDDSTSIAVPSGCVQPGKDKFFLWTACETDQFTVDTCGLANGLDTVLMVYDVTGGFDCNAASLSPRTLVCNDNFCGSDASVTFSATASRQYLIRLGVYPNTPGGSGQWRLTKGGPPPSVCTSTGNAASSGRDCSERGELIQGTGVFGFRLDDSSGQAGPPDCERPLRDTYCRWIACQDGQVTFDTCGLVGDLDTVIVVYDITGSSDPCSNLGASYLTCNDSLNCCATARATFVAARAREYLVRIGVTAASPAASGGFFEVYFGFPDFPTQVCNPGGGEDCSDGGTEISGTGEFMFDLDSSSSRPAPPANACPQPARDRYFAWTSDRTDTVTVDTCNLVGTLDTVIVVYDITAGLNCDNLNATYVACNDDGACGAAATVSFQATVGARYLIRIGVAPGTPGDRGAFRVSYASGGPEPELFGEGSGLHAKGSPRLRNLLLLNNISESGGAGALIEGASPQFADCIFAENYANFGAGALVRLDGSTGVLKLERVTFERNSAVRVGTDIRAPRGGGLMVTGHGPGIEVSGCAFVGNFALNRGAGLYTEDDGMPLSVTVLRSRFSGNEVPRDGNPDSGDLDAAGGGIYAMSRLALVSCSLWDNRARRLGAGIFVAGRQASVVNSTIALNRVNTEDKDIGVGLLSYGVGALVQVENSIVWMNRKQSDEPADPSAPDAPQPPEKRQLWADAGGFLAVRTSCFNLPDRYRGNGNFGLDPKFLDLDGGSLELNANSPCIDRGNSFVDTLPQVPGAQLLATTLDAAGNPRVADGNGDSIPAVDVGAFEMAAEEEE